MFLLCILYDELTYFLINFAMVYPIPGSNLPSSETLKAKKKSARRRKNRSSKKNKRNAAENKNRFVVSMSSWAEQFTAAATWQIKHQLAYWKAKAISLEYENKILHDIIRKNCGGPSKGSQSDFQDEPMPETFDSQSETEKMGDEVSEEDCEDEEECEDEEGGRWEVSEEFLEFLKNNAKFREEARRERERFKASQVKNEVEILEAGPSPPKNNNDEMKELYGTNWQKIAALEMSAQSNYINSSDKLKATYWPNIPLNL